MGETTPGFGPHFAPPTEIDIHFLSSNSPLKFASMEACPLVTDLGIRY